jgi:hypothetical protein
VRNPVPPPGNPLANSRRPTGDPFVPKQTTRSRTTTRKSTTGKKAPSTKRKASVKRERNQPDETESDSAAPGEALATIDRRRKADRRGPDSEPSPSSAATAGLERRQKVSRRRQIDPTTCERDYTDDEIEFMNALDEYKRKSGRMFPTCSEVLEVIRDLGYVKLAQPGHGAARTPRAEVESVATA